MELPDRLGRYLVSDVIGTGGFATVYRASDPRIGGTVAIKVLAENHNLDPAIRERFLTEARVLRRIDSEYVVRLYDLDETERKQPYLVMGYADRGSLAERVRQLRANDWRISPTELLTAAQQLASGVDAVHRVQVVHRDLSPGNVLVRTAREHFTDEDDLFDDSTPQPVVPPPTQLLADDERLVLADLGLCKDLALNSGITVSSGTEGFRAPEQREPAASVTVSTDLWGLSALTVWLVTGRPPSGDRPADGVRGAGIPDRMSDVLAKSLQDNPDKRHQDVRSWLADVEDALGVPNQAGVQTPGLVPPGTPPQQTKSQWWIGIPAALAAGALLTWGAMTFMNGEGDPTPITNGSTDDATSDWGGEFSVGTADDLPNGSSLGPVPDMIPVPAETLVESGGRSDDRPWNWTAFLSHPSADPNVLEAFFNEELPGLGWDEIGRSQRTVAGMPGAESEWAHDTFAWNGTQRNRFTLQARVEPHNAGARVRLIWTDHQLLSEHLDD